MNSNEYNRILYAEDSDFDIELTLEAFKECNLANTIDVVKDGVEVLDYLFYRGAYSTSKNGVPKFMLLGLKISKLDGNGVLKKIRKSDVYKNIPLIVLTSSKIG